MTDIQLKRDDLVYPELSYKIVGVLFEVFRKVGSGYKENYYQKAVAAAFKDRGLKFQEQASVPLMFNDTKIGINYLDFLIEDKIVLELKKGDYFQRATIEQVNQYLKATNLKLALIAVFTSGGVKVKRLVNVI